MIENINLVDIITISLKAGEKILGVYHSSDFEIERKADHSPLTMADKQSHHVITEELNRLYPDIPILSEEGDHQDYANRKEWKSFWLVDPLDGTKEFIKRNGEFTVNIALIEDGQPVFGVIYAPVLDTVYIGSKHHGAYKLENASKKPATPETTEEWLETAQKLPVKKEKDAFTIIASRSHRSKETENFIKKQEKQHGKIASISAGSSLKLCLVAEGTADVYPRFAPTMEWDTAAGHAIIQAAGGTVTQANTNKPLAYNKENLLNPWFVAQIP